MPRVIVELDNPQDHVALVTHATADVIETLMSEVMDKQYDGLVRQNTYKHRQNTHTLCTTLNTSTHIALVTWAHGRQL